MAPETNDLPDFDEEVEFSKPVTVPEDTYTGTLEAVKRWQGQDKKGREVNRLRWTWLLPGKAPDGGDFRVTSWTGLPPATEKSGLGKHFAALLGHWREGDRVSPQSLIGRKVLQKVTVDGDYNRVETIIPLPKEATEAVELADEDDKAAVLALLAQRKTAKAAEDAKARERALAEASANAQGQAQAEAEGRIPAPADEGTVAA